MNRMNLSKQSKQQCTQARQKWMQRFSETYADSLNFSLIINQLPQNKVRINIQSIFL